MASGAIKSLKQLEKDVLEQGKIVNDLQHASIANGYSARGDEYARKQQEAEKTLQKMALKYQQELHKASNILKNIK